MRFKEKTISKKIDKRIEIVRSPVRGLSSMSQESSEGIFVVLAKNYTDVRVTSVNNLSDLEALATRRPDLVFLGMEFVPRNLALGRADPDKIWLSDYLDERGIAYTGSSQPAHKLERNKPLAKQRILDVGLSTSAFCVIARNQPLARSDVALDFPLFVKPASHGGGFGIDSDSVVHNYAQLAAKVNSITTGLRSDALVEEYLPGREFSVAILKVEHMTGFSVMPLELIAPEDKNGARLLSSRVKSANAELALEVVDEALKSRVAAFALAVFYALGARDYGRVDIRLDAAGAPHFLEANLLPSLISGYGSFPKACVLNIGLDYAPMILQITRLGLARSASGAEVALELDALNGAELPADIVSFEPA